MKSKHEYLTVDILKSIEETEGEKTLVEISGTVISYQVSILTHLEAEVEAGNLLLDMYYKYLDQNCKASTLSTYMGITVHEAIKCLEYCKTKTPPYAVRRESVSR